MIKYTHLLISRKGNDVMKKILSLTLCMMLLVTVFVPSTMAATRVATEYLNETFGTSTKDVFVGSSTVNDPSNYGSWILTTTNYSDATMEIVADPKNSSNMVLKLHRSKQNTGSAPMQAKTLLKDNVKLNSDIVEISLDIMYDGSVAKGFPLGIEPIGNLNIWDPTQAGVTDSDNFFLELSKMTKISPTTVEQRQMMSATNTWRTHKFVIDYNNTTFSWYCEGELIGSLNAAPAVSYINLFLQKPENRSRNNIYVDNIKVEKITSTTSYEAKSVSYTDSDNMFCVGPQAGGQLETAKISKAAVAGGSGTAIFAYYNESKELKSVKPINFSPSDFNSEGIATLDVQMNLPANSSDVTNGEVKVFFWDGMTNLKPLEEPASFAYKANTAPQLFVVGDSINHRYYSYQYPISGIAQQLGMYFNGVTVTPKSTSGATTSSTLSGSGDANNRWKAAVNESVAGDYVMIQLGTNDSRNQIGADTYINNLKTMFNTLNAKGVNVILSTPIIDRRFTSEDENGIFTVTFDANGKFVDTDNFTYGGEDYLERLYALISEKENSGVAGFASVDMTKATSELIGPNAKFDDDSRKYYFMDSYYNWDAYKEHELAAMSIYNPEETNPDRTYVGDEMKKSDSTHLTLYGADVFAREEARLIKALDISLSDYVTNLERVITYPNLEYGY